MFSFSSSLNDKPIEDAKIDFRSNKKSITIENVTEAHSGLIRVLAKNHAGQDEATWNVFVESNKNYLKIFKKPAF